MYASTLWLVTTRTSPKTRLPCAASSGSLEDRAQVTELLRPGGVCLHTRVTTQITSIPAPACSLHASLGFLAHSDSPFTLGVVPPCCVCACTTCARAGFMLLPSERAAGGVEVPVFLCCDTAPSPLVSLPLSRCPVWCLRSLLAEAGLFRYENVAPGKGHAY